MIAFFVALAGCIGRESFCADRCCSSRADLRGLLQHVEQKQLIGFARNGFVGVCGIARSVRDSRILTKIH